MSVEPQDGGRFSIVRWDVLSCIAVLLAVGIVWTLVYPPTGEFRVAGLRDDGYVDIGLQIASGNGYSNSEGKPTAYRVPGLPLFCAAGFYVFGEVRGMVVIELLQRLFLLAGAGLLWCSLFKAFGWRWAWAGFLSVVCDPFFYAHGGSFTQTAGSFFVSAVLLFWLPVASERRGGLQSVWIGLAFAAAVLFRQAFFLPALLYTAWMFFSISRRQALCILVGLLLGMSPWWIRNAIVFNGFTLTDTGVSSLIAGCYNDITMNNIVGAEAGWVLTEKDWAELPSDEFAAVGVAVRFAYENCRKHSLYRLAHLEWLKLMRFLYPYVHVKGNVVAYVVLFAVGLLLLLGFVFFLLRGGWSSVRGRPEEKYVHLAALFVFASLVLSLAFYANPRLLFPFVPFRIMVSLAGLRMLFRGFKS